MIRKLGWKNLKCGVVASGVAIALALLFGPSLRVLWSESTGSMRTLPAGTAIAVHLTQPLDSKNPQPGDRFEARVVAVASLMPNVVVAPGTLVEARCLAARPADGLDRPGYLRLTLSGMRDSRGHNFPLETTTISQWGKIPAPLQESMSREDLERIAGGSASNPKSLNPEQASEATINTNDDLVFVLLKPALVSPAPRVR